MGQTACSPCTNTSTANDKVSISIGSPVIAAPAPVASEATETSAAPSLKFRFQIGVSDLSPLEKSEIEKQVRAKSEEAQASSGASQSQVLAQARPLVGQSKLLTRTTLASPTSPSPSTLQGQVTQAFPSQSLIVQGSPYLQGASLSSAVGTRAGNTYVTSTSGYTQAPVASVSSAVATSYAVSPAAVSNGINGGYSQALPMQEARVIRRGEPGEVLVQAPASSDASAVQPGVADSIETAPGFARDAL